MTDTSAVRAPKQARTRASWERVLEVGRALIEQGGVEALTVTEVCRRSGISPPSLYARVDGRAGLFAAVWAHGMAEIAATEDRLFDGLPRTGASVVEQAVDAAGAIAGVFETHARFLRPVISRAESDPALLARGADESRRLLRRTADAIDVEPEVGAAIARTLYAECVVRTMYGAGFFSDEPETGEVFRRRIARTAAASAVMGHAGPELPAVITNTDGEDRRSPLP